MNNNTSGARAPWDQPDIHVVVDKNDNFWRRTSDGYWYMLRGLMGGTERQAAEVESLYGPCAPIKNKAMERRDALPSVDDLAVALTYADGVQINPVMVALRLDRARLLHGHAQQVLDEMWALVDAARNRP